MRAWLVLPLLVVPVAVLGVRRTAPSPVLPSVVAVAAASPGSECAETQGDVAKEERLVPEDALRFEPLDPPPRELVVRIVLGDSEEPVQDAEVFRLERDDYEWLASGSIDVEALARAQGRKVECDEQARVHLGLPERVVFLCARKGELFGAAQFDADDAPEDELRLVPNWECRVHVVSAGGAPEAGIPVVLGEPGCAWWRANTGPDGEVRVPNVQWLVGYFGDDEDPWSIAVEEASSSPSLRAFVGAEAVPRELELRLAPGCALTLELQASDGTPVPLRGKVVLSGVQGHGRSLGMWFGERLWSEFALLDGKARLARTEPEASLVVQFELEGGFYHSEAVRVPDGESSDVALRLPAEAQVLLFRAVDALGAPLAGRRLTWITYEEVPGGPTQLDVAEEEVHTDELGRGALVLDRSDLEPPEFEEGEEVPAPRRHRALLRLCDGPAPLASAALDLDALTRGSVCDLGALRLEPVPLLVRGRVVDGDGAPLARVSVSLQHWQFVEDVEQSEDLPGVGELLTGPDGRFAFHGACTGGRLQLLVERDGFSLPADAERPLFDCGASPELEIILVRVGSLRVSVLADARLGNTYSWNLRGPDGETSEYLWPSQGPGEIVSDFWWLRPGRYRIELVTGYPLDAKLVAFEDVLVRPGARTLDPRLLRVPLHGLSPARATELGSKPELPPIRLLVTDAAGRVLNEGLRISWGGCGWTRGTFHGAIELRADQDGSRIGVWAPGQRYWEGVCRRGDERIALQPALRASVHVGRPRELQREGVCVFVDVLERDEDESAEWLPDRSDSGELDARGEVRFECPAPGRMRLGLHAVQLDPSGSQRRVEAALEGDDEFWIRVADVPGEQRFEFAPPAAVWAALARDLELSR